MPSLSVKQRVAAGANFLDEHSRKTWRRDLRKRLDELEIRSCTRCVLGILYGFFGDGRRRLKIEEYKTSRDLGFDVRMTREGVADWDDADKLTEAWRKFILETTPAPRIKKVSKSNGWSDGSTARTAWA